MLSESEQRKIDIKLGKAIYSGDLPKIEALVAQGANVNATMNAMFYDSQTMLGLAAETGRVNVISFLLDRGADIDAQDKHGFTPLMRAARQIKEDAAALLIERGANLLLRSGDNQTAYEAAYGSVLDMARAASERVVLRSLCEDSMPLMRLLIEAEQAAKNPASPAAEEVTLRRAVGDRVLEQVFNFAARERVTLVRESAQGPVEAVTVDDFAGLHDSASLRQAFEEYRKRGGALTEGDIFGNILRKPRQWTGEP